MPINWKSKIILFEIETVYGTDPAPVGADNAVLAIDGKLSPMEGEDVSRELEMPFLGAQGMIPVGLRAKLSFKVELVGSGTPGTAPKWGPLLRACAVAQTVNAGVSVVYNPVSSGHESGTFHFYIGDTRHVFTGARGTATLRFAAQAIPYLEFEFTGLWAEPSEQARPTPVLTGFAQPVIVTDANTPTFSINSVIMVLREAALNLNNQVEPRLLVNSTSILITDRADAFSARVEAMPVSAFNPYALANARTPVEVALVHGTAAGKIATLALPTCQVKRLSGLENAQNTLEWPLELIPLAASGNDQWSLSLS